MAQQVTGRMKVVQCCDHAGGGAFAGGCDRAGNLRERRGILFDGMQQRPDDAFPFAFYHTVDRAGRMFQQSVSDE